MKIFANMWKILKNGRVWDADDGDGRKTATDWITQVLVQVYVCVLRQIPTHMQIGS